MTAPHRPQPPQQGQHRSQRQPEAALPSSFLGIRFGRPLDPELFNGQALQAAKDVAAADRNRNKSTQLRRFYDELVLWETRVTQQPAKFNEYLPFIRMLNAKAAYAEGRKLVDRTFVALLSHTLKEVNSAETLTTCKLFWEAFMGFYKQERGDN